MSDVYTFNNLSGCSCTCGCGIVPMHVSRHFVFLGWLGFGVCFFNWNWERKHLKCLLKTHPLWWSTVGIQGGLTRENVLYVGEPPFQENRATHGNGC